MTPNKCLYLEVKDIENKSAKMASKQNSKPANLIHDPPSNPTSKFNGS